MAEQAINTIYLLGEHPDELCTQIIQNLTRRAFGRQPTPTPEANGDAMDEDPDVTARSGSVSTMTQDSQVPRQRTDLGDAFLLSQLIFVVGHVAIKHIVFLEIVEKEWKRQKEEREKAEKDKRKGKRAKTYCCDWVPG